MRKKKLIGIAMMLLSAMLMIVWETAGRKYFTQTEAAVASRDIGSGDLIDASSFEIIRFPDDALIQDFLAPDDVSLYYGAYAARDLKKKELLGRDDFRNEKENEWKNASVFTIPREWILSCTSALRQGDTVRIIYMPRKQKIGSYTVAFVRDTSGTQTGMEEPRQTEWKDRIPGPKDVGTLEIICTEKEYYKIYDTVVSYRNSLRISPDAENPYDEPDRDPACLLIVPEGLL